MDQGQAIEYLARAEARRARPIRDADELAELEARHGRPLSAIEVRDVAGAGHARLEAVGLDREPRHDNAPRLPALVDFLNRRVLPMMDAEAKAAGRGTWRVELHDSYSYLPDRHRYEEALTFGRAPDALERRVALIPDPYHMSDFGGGGLIDAALADPVAWERKEPKLFFAGTTTGDRDPAANARVRACVWSVGRPDAKLWITKVAQMPMDRLLRAHPSVAEAMHAPVPLQEHFRYRYQVNIAGNTACWSRLPMLMATRSVVVHARDAYGAGDAMWYYPLVREGRHYVAADSPEGADLLRAKDWCAANDRRCQAIAEEARALAATLFRSGTAATYLAAFLAEH